MVSNSNNASMTRRLQTYITSFCQIFFIFSLPAVLYLEIVQRLYPEFKCDFNSSILFPPKTTVFAYSSYVIFTNLAFVLLCLVERAEVIHEDGQLISRTTMHHLAYGAESQSEAIIGPAGEPISTFR